MKILASSLMEVDVIETQLFINKIVPGIPRGKITEIFGDASVGKSTLTLQVVAEAQNQGLKCLFVDVEYSYSPLYASKMGVDNKRLDIVRERDAEAILDATEEAIEKYDLIIFDSVGALTPQAEIEKGAEGKVIGGQAGLIARFCRKAVPLLSINNTALVMINHSFTDIMSGVLTTSGGKKLSYHKSLSIRLKAKSGVSLKQGEKVVGKVITAIIAKDKVWGNEKAEGDGQLIFNQGFSIAHDQFDDELKEGRITKNKNTYMRDGEVLGVGRMKAAEKLKELLTKEIN